MKAENRGFYTALKAEKLLPSKSGYHVFNRNHRVRAVISFADQIIHKEEVGLKFFTSYLPDLQEIHGGGLVALFCRVVGGR